MTRKHFIAIAEILDTTSLSDDARRILAIKFANLFSQENPNFDSSRFYKAAGLQNRAPDWR